MELWLLIEIYEELYNIYLLNYLVLFEIEALFLNP